MLICISDVLDAATVDAVRDFAAEGASYVDGRGTAGWRAREVKNNLQARSGTETADALRTVENRLLANELFTAAARPKRLVGLRFSRYEPGMAYGGHVDDALMDGVRTDLSFTIFLSEPDSYEGGALVIDDASGEQPFRLAPGAAVLYPSTSLHRVEPVSRGVRLAVVGWVRSYVRDPRQREMLFDLDRAARAIQSTGEASDALDLILKTRSNLLRMWVED